MLDTGCRSWHGMSLAAFAEGFGQGAASWILEGTVELLPQLRPRPQLDQRYGTHGSLLILRAFCLAIYAVLAIDRSWLRSQPPQILRLCAAHSGVANYLGVVGPAHDKR